MEAGVSLTLEVLAFHFRSPVNYRSFGFGGYAFSHIGGPEVIPALLDNSQSTRSLWSKAHLLKHSLASAHHHCAFRLYVAPREKGRPYQREGYRVLSARLSLIQRRAHPGLVIVKRFPCLASLPQELRAATPPGRAVGAWCLSWLVV